MCFPWLGEGKSLGDPLRDIGEAAVRQGALEAERHDRDLLARVVGSRVVRIVAVVCTDDHQILRGDVWDKTPEPLVKLR